MKAIRTGCVGLTVFAIFVSMADAVRADARVAFLEWMLVRVGVMSRRVPVGQLKALEVQAASRLPGLTGGRSATGLNWELMEPGSANLLRSQSGLASRPQLQELLRRLEADQAVSATAGTIGRQEALQFQALRPAEAAIAKEKSPFLDIGVFDGKVKIGEFYVSKNLVVRGGEFNAYKPIKYVVVPGGAAIYCATQECYSKLVEAITDAAFDRKNTRELLEMARKASAAPSNSETPAASGAQPAPPSK